MADAPLTRKDLQAMACLTRVESFVGHPMARRFHGRLAYEPEIGCPLVFLRDDRRRVITSTVIGLDSTPEGDLLVETVNSRYRVGFLTSRESAS